MRVFGMMLTCNEIDYLHYSLQSILPHVEKLLVYDVSTDGTKDYLKKFDKVITYHEEDHPELISLSYKREFLLNEGRKFGATHYICIDADEIMSTQLSSHIHQLLGLLDVGQKCFIPWYHIIDSKFNYVRGGYTMQAIMFRDKLSLSYINATKGNTMNHTHEYRSPYEYGVEDRDNDLEIGYYPLLHFGRNDLHYLEWKNVRSMIAEYIDGKVIDQINFRYLEQETVTLETPNPIKISLLPEFIDGNIVKICRNPDLIKASIKKYVEVNNVTNETLYRLDIFRNEDIARFFINNVHNFDVSKAKWVHNDGKVYTMSHRYRLLYHTFKSCLKNDKFGIFNHILDFFKFRLIKALKI